VNGALAPEQQEQPNNLKRVLNLGTTRALGLAYPKVGLISMPAWRARPGRSNVGFGVSTLEE
jgi:hypothetical protein